MLGSENKVLKFKFVSNIHLNSHANLYITPMDSRKNQAAPCLNLNPETHYPAKLPLYISWATGGLNIFSIPDRAGFQVGDHLLLEFVGLIVYTVPHWDCCCVVFTCVRINSQQSTAGQRQQPTIHCVSSTPWSVTQTFTFACPTYFCSRARFFFFFLSVTPIIQIPNTHIHFSLAKLRDIVKISCQLLHPS